MASNFDPTITFITKVQIPLLSILFALLWALIVIRLRGIRKSNIEFPSYWRTASGVFIVMTGLFCLVYLGTYITYVIDGDKISNITPPLSHTKASRLAFYANQTYAVSEILSISTFTVLFNVV
jgi:hypothetical protein